MTTDKNNAASDPQPAELADQQGDHVPDAILRCAIRAFERARKDYKLRLCNEEPQGKKEAIEALSMEAALQAAFALAATGKQQVGEVQGVSLPPLPPVDGYDKRVQGHYSAAQMQSYAHAALAARQPGAQVPVAFAVESPAFETHAKLAGLNMEQHPLHYLFLDPKTYAARQAWKAALKFAPPAQGIDLGQLREKLTKLTRRNEFISGQSFLYVQLDDVLALIDQRDAAPGVGS